MTKSELIDRIAAKQTQLSSKDVELAVKAVIEYMSQVLSEGERIEIRGFGIFSKKNIRPRKFVNPKTKEISYLGETSTMHFKASDKLLVSHD